ncbi:hypothetical protein CMQ_2185 [Grosmannia clavigera kw1407]|uniref:Capsule polysaccharide biosynthesis protein n=1 Tax=Grosmannia clavigera (strain kw1407 / UAMH 11150) TaxID=655863 RepID=F0XJQ2_GROCL|nr:uncharacterized protein CMQ_2185 [Grosmannia clavigera kw1407]EFX02136.1 hypothetical protein CMQ_2185 [Grosmannia clavigera kw1407]
MASARGLADFGVLIPLFGTVTVASTAYAGHAVFWRSDWRGWLSNFATGPGRTSRLMLLVMLLINLKSIPFAWTVRVFSTMIRHVVLPRKPLPRRSLFHYSITSSYTSLLETDYNLHKSNSTYFSDLDTSRSHLVMYLLGPGVAALGDNAKTKMVRLPTDETKAVPGNFGVGLGAVFCSFRKEIASYQGYEMWSRILSWDRKWLFVLTHFVVKGKVRPAVWDQVGPAPASAAWTDADEEKLQKHVIATAISKYVFKLGRFTVHPSYLIEGSDLLPARPGEGWRGGGPDAIGDLADLDSTTYVPPAGNEDADWDWRRVEHERRRGMEYAQHMMALDSAADFFDGGRLGALGKFSPG